MGSDKDNLLNLMKEQLDSFFYNIKQLSQHSRLEGSLNEGLSFLLYILWISGRSKVSDIAQKLGITNGAVTQMADKMVKADLIIRERSEEDRRIVWLSLSEKGKNMVNEIHNSRFEYFRSRLSQLSEEDLENSIEVFQKLNALLGVIKKSDTQ